MVAQNSDKLIGHQLDQYHIEQLLTQRKSSALYLARDVRSEGEVLLEVAKQSVKENQHFADAFQHNMSVIQTLGQPNIAKVLQISQSSGKRPFAVIENQSTTTLADKLADWARENNTLPVIKALELVRHLAATLSIAHRAGIIHHDLRPSNIFMREDNTPVFVDLGVPHVPEVVEQKWEIGQNNVIDYIAPEQQEGREITPRSNIYSLGVILYELLAGHAPKLPATSWDIFDRDATPKEVPLEEARIGLTSETYRLVRNCLWRQEWSRYDNATELINALDAAIAAERALPKVLPVPTSTRRWLPIAIPVIIVLIILGIFLNSGNDPNDVEANSIAQATTVVPTATSTATPTATTPPTRTPVPVLIPPTLTPTAELVIELLEPLPGSEFAQGDTITFDWRWPVELSPGQQFAIYLFTSTQVSLVETVKEPILGFNYRARIPVSDLNASEANVDWQVVLETVATGNSIFESERRPLTLQLEPPTPTVTPTPSITPTTDCVISPPPSWVLYTIKSGDSLFNLAIAGGSSLDFVLQVNCLPPDPVLSVGQKVYIPRPPATNTPTPAPVPPTATPGRSGGGGGGGDKPPTPPP
ncbi:MAG: protein kinase [Anaerolineales bacterium]|nr:protein kinase [Anaerolineales bacterium]